MRIQINDEVRDATKEEKAVYDFHSSELQAATEARTLRTKAAASARAKLAALGLTEAEIAALLGA